MLPMETFVGRSGAVMTTGAAVVRVFALPTEPFPPAFNPRTLRT